MPTRRVILGAEPGEIPSTHLRTGVFQNSLNAVVQLEQNLPYVICVNTFAGGVRTINATPRATSDVGPAVVPFIVPASGLVNIPTSTFASIQDPNANGAVYWFFSDVPLPSTAGGSGGIIQKLDIPAASGETLTSNGMFGFGGAGGPFSATPKTTKVVVTMSGSFGISSGTNLATFQVSCQMAFGTGTAPVNGAAFTGTTFGGISQLNETSGAAGSFDELEVPFSLTGVATVVAGTTYWFDLQGAISEGTETIYCLPEFVLIE
jgi:hypothetical protein